MIHILTDTSADITVPQALALRVELIPLDIHFGDRPYDPLADESFDTFYDMLGSCKELPTTSQPTPARFLEVYEKAKENGDDVLVLTISSKISGTYQSALLAKEMAAYDRIEVIDTLTTIIGQRLLVELAASLRDQGKILAEISAILYDAIPRMALIAGLDTLKYLRKGGRIPKSAELLGTVLGVKPLVQLIDGSIVMAGKARGRNGVMQALMDMIAEKSDFDLSAPIYFGYTCHDAQARELHRRVTDAYGFEDTYLYPIGSVVGTHVGPGAFAIVYLRKGRNDK